MTSTTTMRTAAADVGLSIVVPVYNEGRGLRAFHDRLCDVARALRQKRGLATEVVYVDDGSRDDSLAVAQALPAEALDVQVISLSRNFGKEAALMAGLDHARLGAVLFARGQTAPAFDAQLRIPTVACQDAVDSVPVGFAPMLEGLRCEGDLSYDVKASLDTAHMDSLKFELGAALQTVRITSMGKYVRFDIFDAPFEHHARQKDGTLYTFETGPGTELWAPLESITPYFVKVLTTTEDGGSPVPSPFGSPPWITKSGITRWNVSPS